MLRTFFHSFNFVLVLKTITQKVNQKVGRWLSCCHWLSSSETSNTGAFAYSQKQFLKQAQFSKRVRLTVSTPEETHSWTALRAFLNNVEVDAKSTGLPLCNRCSATSTLINSPTLMKLLRLAHFYYLFFTSHDRRDPTAPLANVWSHDHGREWQTFLIDR